MVSWKRHFCVILVDRKRMNDVMIEVGGLVRKFG